MARAVSGKYRRVLGGVALGVGAATAVGAAAIAATLGSAWIVSVALSSDPSTRLGPPRATTVLALAPSPRPAVMTAATTAPVQLASGVSSRPRDPADIDFASRWAVATPVARAPDTARTQVAELTPATAPVAPPRPPKPEAERAAAVPLPRPAPPVAAAPPRPDITASIPDKPDAPQRNRLTSLPEPGSRTAVYDISAHTVYLPSGARLEAHSGLGDRMDDPASHRVKMRGVTPPNTYNLTMRESLFHGVQAIRLNPVDEDKMFGRDGILAHSYMLGPNGQSNGCVSFKDYPAFLRAVRSGEVARMVVVPGLGNAPAPTRTARAPSVRRWNLANSSATAAVATPTLSFAGAE
jgi:type VI secretion system (T6SS) effector TldE1-like protein